MTGMMGMMRMRTESRFRSGWRLAMALSGVVATCWLTMAIVATPQTRSSSQPPTKAQVDFFESKIRPIFANNCYRCHSPANGNPRGGLELDWKGGWEKGGSEGPAIV